MPVKAKGRLKEIMGNPNSLTTTKFAMSICKKIEGKREVAIQMSAE